VGGELSPRNVPGNFRGMSKGGLPGRNVRSGTSMGNDRGKLPRGMCEEGLPGGNLRGNFQGKKSYVLASRTMATHAPGTD